MGAFTAAPSLLTFIAFRGPEFFGMTSFAVAAVAAIQSERHA
jgi:hypothetical protein